MMYMYLHFLLVSHRCMYQNEEYVEISNYVNLPNCVFMTQSGLNFPREKYLSNIIHRLDKCVF